MSLSIIWIVLIILKNERFNHKILEKVEEVPQKKVPISYNIFFWGTSSKNASEEEAPATEEDILAHMGHSHTLTPRGNQFESVVASSFGECLR